MFIKYYSDSTMNGILNGAKNSYERTRALEVTMGPSNAPKVVTDAINRMTFFV